MDWEPKGHPRILASSGMVQPKMETTIYFKAPKKEGDYPYICTFPGHFQLMNGVMGVSKLANPITNLNYKFYHGSWDKMPDFSNSSPKKGSLTNGLFDLSQEIATITSVSPLPVKSSAQGRQISFTTSSDDGLSC